MNDQLIYSAIRAGIGLYLLAIAAIVMYRKTRLDIFRSDLFAVRDELFLDAARRGVGFQDPAYTDLRNSINGLIRFAHQFHLTSIVLIVLFTRNDPEQKSALDAISGIADPERKAYYLDIYHRVARRALRYLLVEGSQAMIIIPAIAFYVLWRTRGRWLNELPPRVIDSLIRLGRRDSEEASQLKAYMHARP